MGEIELFDFINKAGVGIVFVVIVIAYLSYTNANTPVTIMNEELINEYPMLRNNDWLGSDMIVKEVPNKELSYDNSSGKSLMDSLICADTNKKPEIKKFSQSYNIGMEGFGQVYVIDCGKNYWVHSIGDYGSGPLVGPFEKPMK